LTRPTRILFVCLGNIVRSPLAENMFRHLAEQEGLGDKYEVDSAGTSAYHVGESPDPRMRRVAAGRGFEYTGRARQVSRSDLEDFDLVIPMDSSNRDALLELTRNQGQEDKLYLMRQFDPQGGPEAPVPDPYYGGIDGFENVFNIVQRSCQGLLDALESGELEA
jgi:protein-tyrosine phosphatase